MVPVLKARFRAVTVIVVPPLGDKKMGGRDREGVGDEETRGVAADAAGEVTLPVG